MLIAGGGEQMTLRAGARLADACNYVTGDVGKIEIAEVRHKLAVLRKHCDTAGRDYTGGGASGRGEERTDGAKAK